MPERCSSDRERCARCARRVPWVTFFGNVGLTLYKGTVGIIGGSNALVADAVHSFTDIIGTTVILLSCRVSERPPDESHPYGHGKAEFLSAAFIYVVLTFLATALFVGGLVVILRWELHAPNIVTLLGAGISVYANLMMHKFGVCAGTRNNSPALLANAFENRADAISSVAVVIGIALGIYVHPICDSLAAMGVGVIIFSNCVVQLREALNGLLDRALPEKIVRRIVTVADSHEGVERVAFVKTRAVGAKYWVDLGITIRAGSAMAEAEAIAAELRRDLMTRSKHFATVEVIVLPEGAAA